MIFTIKQRISYKDTNIFLQTDRKELLDVAYKTMVDARTALDSYIIARPEFQASLEPIAFDEKAPEIAKRTMKASGAAGVGPMAAVAGAVADFVREALVAKGSSFVVVENGGDNSIQVSQKINVSVYAGESSLSGNIGFEVRPDDTPIGICTSSGTVGPSMSFGEADAAVAVARSACVADAAATAIGNLVSKESDIDGALAFAKTLQISGALVIKNETLGAVGKLPKIIKAAGLPVYFYKDIRP